MRPTDDLRTWAAAYREAGQPSEALRQRILFAVETVEDEPIEAPREPSSWRTTAVGLGVGALLGVAALLLLMLAVRFVRPHAEEASAVPSTAPFTHTQEREAAETKARAPATSVREEKVAPEPAPIVEPTSPSASVAPRKAAPVSTPTASAVEPAPQPEAPVRAPSEDLESLRRLRAAEQQLASDPARARALLEAHARAYPSTSVDIEREALWIRAACRSGGDASLERRRAAFAKRAGVAAYLSAIARDCDRR